MRARGAPSSTGPDVALIGFGEVAGLLAAAARAGGGPRLAVTFLDHGPSPITRDRLTAAGISPEPAAACLPGAGLVASAVVPSAAVAAARSAAPLLRDGAVYLDLNSIGNGDVDEIAAAVAAGGAHFAKAAVLGPVPLMGRATPLVVGGPGAVAAADWLRAIGFDDVAAGPDPAAPARVKLLWSIVTKGITALYTEALLGGHRLGLLDELLRLLRNQAGFLGSEAMVGRLLVSNLSAGARRGEEVAAAEHLLADVGIGSRTTGPTRYWLATLAQLGELPSQPTTEGEGLGVADAVAWLSGVMPGGDQRPATGGPEAEAGSRRPS